MRETLDITITLFDDQTPILQRVQFLAGSENATTIAIDWDPQSLVGVAASWFTLNPSLNHFELFFELAAVFTNPVENLCAQVQCPILKGTLTLYQSVYEGFNEEDWARRLVQASMCARLDMRLDLDPPFSTGEVPQNARAAFKATCLYLSFMRGAGQPQWFLDWKQHRTEQKATAKTHKAAVDPESRKDHRGDDGDGLEAAAHGNGARTEKQADMAHGSGARMDVSGEGQAETPHGSGARMDLSGEGQAEPAHGSGARADVSGEGQAETAHGNDARGQGSALFQVGDIVVGNATKNKAAYHLQKAKIVKVLSKQYSVEMLEGEKCGETHKYLHENVSACPTEAPPAQLSVVEMLDPERTAKTSTQNIALEIGDLWD